MASDLKKQHDLEKLYATLPTIECKGECHSACGPIGMTDVEWRRIFKRTGREPTTLVEEHDGKITDLRCSLLTENLKCSIYSIRPMVCRLWGLVDALKCPWGCVPDPGWLDYREGQLLLLAAEEISTDDPEELNLLELTRQRILAMSDEEMARVSAMFTVPPVKQ